MSNPSAHTTATGPALATVQKHQKEEDVVLYASWHCPFAQRTWLALEEKGVPYQYKEENPYLKTSEFLKLSPKGLVPAVVYKNRPINESLVINEFLEDAFPDSKPLLPRDPYLRAQVRLANDHISKNIVPNFFRLVQTQDKPGQEAVLQTLYAGFNDFAAKFIGEGPWFLGSEISLADLTLVPVVARLRLAEEYRGFSMEKTDPKFQVWKKHASELSSFKNTTSDWDAYVPLFMPYLRDEAQSEVAKAIRAGTVIP